MADRRSDRRAFLINAGTLAIVAGMASACGENSSEANRSLADLKVRLKISIATSEEALDFGRIYLADHTQAMKTETLLASIAEAMKPFQTSDLTAVKRAIEADYMASRVVSLSGWQVSDVEAKIYAVLYLESQD